MHNATILVLFGATGDLASKKIIPALYELHKAGKLSNEFNIVGFARRFSDDNEYKEYVKSLLEDGKDLESFLNRIKFHQGDVERKEDFDSLRQKLTQLEQKIGICTNKLYYLSLTPQFYKNVLENISQANLAKTCSQEDGWSRIIIEKPFGSNLSTAKSLEEMLSTLFKEEQIYRIDHYLGKDSLQNILAFRFSNNIFENSWNNRFIEKIEVKVLEKIDVGSRGEFYDGVGALRDVGQNHLLQMLALVTMENPLTLTSDRVREMRSRVFEDLHILTPDEIKHKTKRAQYEGYNKTKGVKQDSQTETYFKIEAEIVNERWQAVPIILESGKKMKEDKKEITVTFKKSKDCICPIDSANGGTNKIVFRLSPTEEIEIHIYAKKPGIGFTAVDKVFSIKYDTESQNQRLNHEYQQLLLDVVDGNQTLLVSSEEIKAMWKYIDPIIDTWQSDTVPLESY